MLLCSFEMNYIVLIGPLVYLSRSFTELGSSLEAPMFRAFGGIMSSSEVENPDFHKWNMVDFLYCDGGSFAGIHVYFYEVKRYTECIFIQQTVM